MPKKQTKLQLLKENAEEIKSMVPEEICKKFDVSPAQYHRAKRILKLTNKKKKHPQRDFTFDLLKKLSGVDTASKTQAELQKILGFKSRQAVSHFCKRNNITFKKKRRFINA